jgi:hypothetical protein
VKIDTCPTLRRDRHSLNGRPTFAEWAAALVLPNAFVLSSAPDGRTTFVQIHIWRTTAARSPRNRCRAAARGRAPRTAIGTDSTLDPYRTDSAAAPPRPGEGPIPGRGVATAGRTPVGTRSRSRSSGPAPGGSTPTRHVASETHAAPSRQSAAVDLRATPTRSTPGTTKMATRANRPCREVTGADAVGPLGKLLEQEAALCLALEPRQCGEVAVPRRAINREPHRTSRARRRSPRTPCKPVIPCSAHARARAPEGVHHRALQPDRQRRPAARSPRRPVTATAGRPVLPPAGRATYPSHRAKPPSTLEKVARNAWKTPLSLCHGSARPTSQSSELAPSVAGHEVGPAMRAGRANPAPLGPDLVQRHDHLIQGSRHVPHHTT